MKKALILLAGLILFSCNSSDDSLYNYQDPMLIELVDLPEEFVLNEEYEITITYLKPTTCHVFNDILYQEDNNISTVIVIGTVFQNNGNCTDLNTESQASFNFTANNIGSYIFKFWKGLDDNGEDIYLIVEVPVVN